MNSKLCLLAIGLLLSFQLFSQDELRYFNDDTKLTQCDVEGNAIKNKDSLVRKDVFEGWKFYYSDLPNGVRRIKFLPWSDEDSALRVRNLNYVVDTNGKPVYFIIPNDIFTSLTKVSTKLPGVTVTFGALLLPFRLRFPSHRDPSTGKRDRPLDYTVDLNIGVTVGGRIRLNSLGTQSLSFLFGGSITSTNADSASTHGYLKSTSRISMVTASFSVVCQIDNLQIMATLGRDYPPGELYDKWLYTAKTWLGFGVGLNIFTPKKTTDKQ